jgi:hypothetical protein
MLISTLRKHPELDTIKDADLIRLFGLWMFRGISSKVLGTRLAALAKTRVVLHRITNDLLSKDLLSLKAAILNNDLLDLDRKDRSLLKTIPFSLQKHINRLRRQYGCPSIEEAREDLRISIDATDSWLKKFTYRKHRFIENNQQVGITLTDIRSELRCCAITGYALQWPCFKSNLHKINTLKRIMHNTGINLIKQYTRTKVSGTIVDKGVVSARLVSMDFLKEVQVEAGNVELNTDIKKLASKYKGTKLQMLKLLMGEYIPDFSVWLGTDNDLAFNKWKFDRYLEKCAKWLRVKLEAARRFVDDLRSQLWAYA